MREERKMYEVLVESQKERDHWEDQGVDGIRIDLRETGWGGGVEWIYLSQDKDQWRTDVNAVMNLRVLAPRS
jgi:hypothetical protein